MQRKTRRRAPPRVHSVEVVDVPTPLGDATFEASIESDADGLRMRLSTGDLAEVIAAAVERIRRRQSAVRRRCAEAKKFAFQEAKRSA